MSQVYEDNDEISGSIRLIVWLLKFDKLDYAEITGVIDSANWVKIQILTECVIAQRDTTHFHAIGHFSKVSIKYYKFRKL